MHVSGFWPLLGSNTDLVTQPDVVRSIVISKQMSQILNDYVGVVVSLRKGTFSYRYAGGVTFTFKQTGYRRPSLFADFLSANSLIHI
jgi:hypothetical protein